MNNPHHQTESGPGKGKQASDAHPDVELSPEQAAAAANQLPAEEQLSEFEKELEHIDDGNQPS